MESRLNIRTWDCKR